MDNPSTGEQQPPAPPSAPTGPRVGRDEMKDLGRLRRSVTDRHIAGVAGGLARHLDVDPIIVRVALVVAAFFGGAGLLAYIGAWVLVPEEGTDDHPLGLDQRSRTLALGGVGVLALLCAVGDWAGAFGFPWQLAIVAAIVVWYLNRREKRTPTGGYGYEQPADGGDSGASATYAPPTYATPTYAHDSYAPTSYEVPRQPRHPRRRGPILFGFTMAIVCLAEGALLMADIAGLNIAPSAYPALALGIIATMLIVGSFWGRAGGLIAVGVVAAVATAAATLGNSFPDDRLAYAPTSAGQVQDTYELGGGELTLDLSGISDVDALDGRDLTIDGVGGQIEVIVPEGMDVSVETQVVAGDSQVFDQREEGVGVTLDQFRDGGDEAPDMTITIDLVAGEIIVREAA